MTAITFPFTFDAKAYISTDPDFMAAYNAEVRKHPLEGLSLVGHVQANGVLELSAWAAPAGSHTEGRFDNSCFWRKQILIGTDMIFQFYALSEEGKKRPVRKPLFPFYTDVHHLISKDEEFKAALEKEGRYTTIQRLELSGQVHQDGRLELYAWAATDNGFCSTAGKFWSRTVQLTPERLKYYVDKELAIRANQEIEAEEQAKHVERVLARAEEIRKELGL